MINTPTAVEPKQRPPTPKEGELFKVIELCGKTFEILYGFYEECDRHTKYAEPIAVYPDFAAHPIYTDDGTPFVTAIQSPCKNFDGSQDENSCCEDCAYYLHGEELLGICGCPVNKVMSDE